MTISAPEPKEEVKEVKLSKKKQAALDKKAKAEEEQPVEAARLHYLRTAPPPARLPRLRQPRPRPACVAWRRFSSLAMAFKSWSTR